MLDGRRLPYGQFGENLTVSGLDEAEACIGDRLEVGNALLTITQPRVPCFKLGLRAGEPKLPRLFSESARTGFYLRVLREGVIEAGDEVRVLERGQGGVAVKTLFQAWLQPAAAGAAQVLTRALEVPELAAAWRGQIENKLGGNG
jgi:MOSC domain-containing protein YiiM